LDDDPVGIVQIDVQPEVSAGRRAVGYAEAVQVRDPSCQTGCTLDGQPEDGKPAQRRCPVGVEMQADEQASGMPKDRSDGPSLLFLVEDRLESENPDVPVLADVHVADGDPDMVQPRDGGSGFEHVVDIAQSVGQWMERIT